MTTQITDTNQPINNDYPTNGNLQPVDNQPLYEKALEKLLKTSHKKKKEISNIFWYAIQMEGSKITNPKQLNDNIMAVQEALVLYIFNIDCENLLETEYQKYWEAVAKAQPNIAWIKGDLLLVFEAEKNDAKKP